MKTKRFLTIATSVCGLLLFGIVACEPEEKKENQQTNAPTDKPMPSDTTVTIPTDTVEMPVDTAIGNYFPKTTLSECLSYGSKTHPEVYCQFEYTEDGGLNMEFGNLIMNCAKMKGETSVNRNGAFLDIRQTETAIDVHADCLCLKNMEFLIEDFATVTDSINISYAFQGEESHLSVSFQIPSHGQGLIAFDLPEYWEYYGTFW